MGWDFDQIKEDLGGAIQENGTAWLKKELENRLNPVAAPQPESTKTVLQADATKIWNSYSQWIIYGGAALVGLILIFAFTGKKSGGRRGR